MRRLSLSLVVLGITHTVTAQQPAPKRVHGGLPFVSPDGSRIVFVRQVADTSNEIYVIGADGAGEHRVGPSGNSPAKWLPDGRRLVFGVGKFTEDSSDIRSIDVAGGTPTRFARIAGRDASIAADGKSVVASSGKWPNLKIVRISLADGSTRDLTTASGAFFNVAISPNGKQLAFAHAGPSMSDLQVWVMNADGTDLRQLSHLDSTAGRPQWPSWSPDGKTIAVQSGVYSRTNPAANTSHIWLFDVATGAGTKLASHAAAYLDETPAFFPDGKHIAFQSDRSGTMEVWVMNTDGTGARQITR